MNKKPIISNMAIIVSLIYLGYGLYFLGSYLKGFIGPDKSLIFWYIPIIPIGLALTVSGILFLKIAIKSFNNDKAYKKAKYLLMITLVIIVVIYIISFLSQKQRDRSVVDQKKVASYIESINKIDRLSILGDNRNGFDLLVKTTGGIEGKYNLEIIVYNNQATFLNIAESVNLNSGSKNITKNVNYNNLFRKCFTEFNRSKIYVCTENTGSGTKMKIDAKLTPIQNEIDSKTYGLTNTKQINVKLETFTKNNQVSVNQFEVLDY